MISRTAAHALRHAPRVLTPSRQLPRAWCAGRTVRTVYRASPAVASFQTSSFHTGLPSLAQSPTADDLIENLTELYGTAKDEFEIASEETDKKTVYAAEDREAAKTALQDLQEAYEYATTKSNPDVANEVQRRVGSRIRELEHAVQAMEQRALED